MRPAILSYAAFVSLAQIKIFLWHLWVMDFLDDRFVVPGIIIITIIIIKYFLVILKF